MNYEEKCQLLLIGDSSVGKTSLLYRYTNNNNYNEKHLATVGIDYFTKDEVINNRTVRVKIWDTAGQERYKSLTYTFFRNAQGIILVFDVSNRDTFENLKFWINSIRTNIGSDHNVKIIIIGNKIDLRRQVMKEEAEKYAKEINTEYFETSAKENINVCESIKHIVSLVTVDKKNPWEKESVIKLSKPTNEETNKCRC